ncbi:MAG: hypothetical protein HY965_06860 [Ignavibacteriales bacterium]|nr:hypothetical protein [Ignavibacteriales bacterium]
MSEKKNLDWLLELDLKNYLSEDAQYILEEIGIEKFHTLMVEMNHVRFVFTTAPLYRMKRDFIRKNHCNYTVKEFVTMLNVSESFVYRSLKKESEK